MCPLTVDFFYQNCERVNMSQAIRNIHTKCDRKRKFLFLTHNKFQDHTHVSPVKMSSVNKLLWLLVISVFKFSLSINVPSFLQYSSPLRAHVHVRAHTCTHMYTCARTHTHTYSDMSIQRIHGETAQIYNAQNIGTNMCVRYHQLKTLSVK